MIRLLAQAKNLLEKRGLWDIFTYVFFGGLTTLVNIAIFELAIKIGISWWIANFFAWLISVLFAFVTNKLWVFNSHTGDFRQLAWEFSKFILARIFSLCLDYGFMWLFIQRIMLSQTLSKILTQVVIVIANYALSKFVIFKNKPSDQA